MYWPVAPGGGCPAATAAAAAAWWWCKPAWCICGKNAAATAACALKYAIRDAAILAIWWWLNAATVSAEGGWWLNVVAADDVLIPLGLFAADVDEPSLFVLEFALPEPGNSNFQV